MARWLALALVLLAGDGEPAESTELNEARGLAVAGRLDEAWAHWGAAHEPAREALAEQFRRRLRIATPPGSSRVQQVDETAVLLARDYQPLFDLGLSLALSAQARLPEKRDEIARQAATLIVLGKGVQRSVVAESLAPEVATIAPPADPLRHIGARLRDRVGASSGNSILGTLVDITRFRRDFFDGRSPVDWYAAAVISSDTSAAMRLIDLGAARAIDGSGIDDLVSEFAKQSEIAVRHLQIPEFFTGAARSDGQYLQYMNALDRVTTRVLGPCGLTAGTFERYLFVSPAAQLWLVPFAAAGLPGAPGRHLIDEYHISYLTTSRSLLAPDPLKGPPRGAILIAAPDFSLPPTQTLPERRPGRTVGPPATPRAIRPRDRGRRKAVTFACQFGSFADRGGTMQQFKLRVERQLKAAGLAVHVRADEQATEQAVWEMGSEMANALPAERLVVVCTHGCVVSADSPLKPSPLRGSLLALAAANHVDDPAGLPLVPRPDGVLTAQEIVEKVTFAPSSLVLLIACQSAMGEIAGDHLASMRHAVLFKGAKSVVATSWTVDGESANAFGARFFDAYLKTGRAEESLREAQLFLKTQTGWEHPVYWAPYSVTGELQ